MAWNREHAGVAATPDVAIAWSVTAMAEAAQRLAVAGDWELRRVAVAVGETVWWITLVDATLVRYHPGSYAKALEAEDVEQRETEETLAGLRYVRNELGRAADQACFVQAPSDARAGWTWQSRPEPGLGALAPRARQWELSRYRAYQGRLAGHDIAHSFSRCAGFLAQAALLAASDPGAEENTRLASWRAVPPKAGKPPLRSPSTAGTAASPYAAGTVCRWSWRARCGRTVQM
jgi:hypothetical protein